jgi:hypothetical protein
MKHSILKTGLLVLALATVVACGKKGADGASVNTARDQRAVGPANLPTGQGGTAGTQSANITFNESQKDLMREAVQVLVSPTMNADAVGDIRSISVSGNIGIQGNQQLATDSSLQLVITDSYVGQTEDGATIEPIVIRLRGTGVAQLSGTNGMGSANVSMTDEYGTITVNGTYNAQTFTGTVSFVNKTVGFNNKSQGTLGQFSISTCAFFRCM